MNFYERSGATAPRRESPTYRASLACTAKHDLGGSAMEGSLNDRAAKGRSGKSRSPERARADGSLSSRAVKAPSIRAGTGRRFLTEPGGKNPTWRIP